MDTHDQEPTGACCSDSEKKAYEGKMEQRLKEIGKNIDSFIEKADDKKSCALETINTKREDASNALNELKHSSKEAWSEFKHGVDRAWDDLQLAWSELKTASENAASKFQK